MSFKPAVNCNPLDHLAIQNVLAKYCEALDSKDFGMLDEVFLSNVSADYPFNHELEGVGAVKAAIKNRYDKCSSISLNVFYTCCHIERIEKAYRRVSMPHRYGSNEDAHLASPLFSGCRVAFILSFTLLFPGFPPQLYIALPCTSFPSISPLNPPLTCPSRLGPILTHHALSTQRITFDDSNAEKAYATTYFTGSHFGQGTHEGKVLQAYGKYEDELVLLDDYADYDGVTGASGRWRIISRKVKFTKRIGDERIMSEF
jgi:hypothetical protein